MSRGDFQGFLNLTQMGDPCNEQRMVEVERNLGRRLPSDYRAFVMATGGGCVNPQRFYIPGGFLPDEPGGVDVFCIYGNGTLPNGHCNDLDHPETGVVALGRNWLYPPQALVFAKSSAGGHLVYLLNYEFEEFPLHTVLVANSAGNIGFLAASFSDFLHLLQAPHPS